MQAVAIVGAQLAFICQENEERKKFQELVTDAVWGTELSSFGVSFFN